MPESIPLVMEREMDGAEALSLLTEMQLLSPAQADFLETALWMEEPVHDSLQPALELLILLQVQPPTDSLH